MDRVSVGATGPSQRLGEQEMNEQTQIAHCAAWWLSGRTCRCCPGPRYVSVALALCCLCGSYCVLVDM